MCRTRPKSNSGWKGPATGALDTSNQFVHFSPNVFLVFRPQGTPMSARKTKRDRRSKGKSKKRSGSSAAAPASEMDDNVSVTSEFSVNSWGEWEDWENDPWFSANGQDDETAGHHGADAKISDLLDDGAHRSKDVRLPALKELCACISGSFHPDLIDSSLRFFPTFGSFHLCSVWPRSRTLCSIHSKKAGLRKPTTRHVSPASF